MITVGNLKNTREGIRCDRSSVLGNPFELEREEDRPKVIEGFRKWLWACLNHGDSIKAASNIAELHGLKISPTWKRPTAEQVQKELGRLLFIYQQSGQLTLLCWCEPLDCHTDVIRRCLLWLNKGRKQA